MKLKVLVFGMVLLCGPFLCWAEIREMTQMREVVELFNESQKKTLGVFDVDMVLIHPREPAFQMANIIRYKDHFKSLMSDLSPQKKDEVLTVTVFKENSHQLLELETPDLLNKLTAAGHKLIALTAILTGKFKAIPDAGLHRYEQLKSVGIDFTSAFPGIDNIIFESFEAYRGNFPQFKKGILASNGGGSSLGKGLVLVEFLKRLRTSSDRFKDYKPERIVFVDDLEKNVKDVEVALKAYNPNIEYIGIVFKAAHHYPSVLIDEHDFKNAWAEVIASN